MQRMRFEVIAVALGLLCACVSQATPIDEGQARRAAGKWMRTKIGPTMRGALGSSVRDVESVTNVLGRTLFHLARLEGGGFVVLSADSRLNPVIGFFEGRMDGDRTANPVWSMLLADGERRVAGLPPERMLLNVSTATSAPKSEAELEWEELLADDSPKPMRVQSVTTSTGQVMEDVRVPVLLSTHWGQTTDGSENDCYNYYTPNNYPCGCLATAQAQIMKYHRYPNYDVGWWYFNCQVDGKETYEEMQGRNGYYVWNVMPDDPVSGTLVQRQTIGKLCFDIGVGLCMSWTAQNASSCAPRCVFSLQEIYKYANVRHHQGRINAANNGKYVDASLYPQLIYSNLDAGCPVLIATTGVPPKPTTFDAHALVADGYGYVGNTAYTHLNAGWCGSGDGWYALSAFTPIQDVIYNIFPRMTGEILSGRVLYPDGSPVVGAQVVASCNGTSRTAKTNARGVYAFTLPGDARWTLTASYAGRTSSGTTSVYVQTSVSDELKVFYYGGRHECAETGRVGNYWGANLTVPRTADVSVGTCRLVKTAGGAGVTSFKATEPISAHASIAYSGASLATSFRVSQWVEDASGKTVAGPERAFCVINGEPTGDWTLDTTLADRLPAGVYTYRISANDNNAVSEETNFGNNTASIQFTVLLPWPSNVAVDAAYAGMTPEQAAATPSPSGKFHADGVTPLSLWDECVAGTDPGDTTSVFRAFLTLQNGQPAVTWEPKLPPAEEALRIYTVWGKTNLQDRLWIDATQSADGLRFFRPTVKMR